MEMLPPIFNKYKNGIEEFVLYNTFSKKPIDKYLTSNSTTNTEHLAIGMYIYKLKVDDRIVRKGKLVKNQDFYCQNEMNIFISLLPYYISNI